MGLGAWGKLERRAEGREGVRQVLDTDKSSRLSSEEFTVAMRKLVPPPSTPLHLLVVHKLLLCVSLSTSSVSVRPCLPCEWHPRSQGLL